MGLRGEEAQVATREAAAAPVPQERRPGRALEVCVGVAAARAAPVPLVPTVDLGVLRVAVAHPTVRRASAAVAAPLAQVGRPRQDSAPRGAKTTSVLGYVPRHRLDCTCAAHVQLLCTALIPQLKLYSVNDAPHSTHTAPLALPPRLPLSPAAVRF